MNKYKAMLKEFIKAKRAFEDYENSCVEVDLSLMRKELPNLEVIKLHNLVEKYYPELILSSMMSHGGVDCMKLMSTKEEILECFELIGVHYKDINNKYMQKVVAEFSEDITKSSKNMFSLSKMLKQRGCDQ